MFEKDSARLTENAHDGTEDQDGTYDKNRGLVTISLSGSGPPRSMVESDDLVPRKNTPGAGSSNKKSYSPVKTKPESSEDLRCGLGVCKPECLQVFNNPKAFLVWLCWLAFLQGFMVNGINNVNTSTLERRFQLSSSAVGTVSSSYDISATILAIPVSYYGAHAHQPRMLTFAAFVMACGAMVMTIPHFETGLYDLHDPQADECVIGGNNTEFCENTDHHINKWLGVLVLGMVLNGVGGTILYTIGIVFLDSNVSSKSSPMYQGFFYSSSTLGPAMGYILGGYIVQSLYVDFDQLDKDNLSIDPKDPRFVGAWWLGFAVSGVLLLTVVFLLICYPRELPAAKAARLERTDEVHADGSDAVASQTGFGTTIRDLPRSLRILLGNPVYTCVSLAATCHGLLVSGFATFMPKFIQNQFSLTAGMAAMVGGACVVSGAVGGQLNGAIITRLANLSIRGMLRLTVTFTLLVAVTSTIVLCRCSTPDFAGINRQYENISEPIHGVDLESPCNAACGCTTLSYEPICGMNGVEYFSPCHAGCKTQYINDTKIFVDCSCLTLSEPVDNASTMVTHPGTTPHVSMATEGTCESDCVLYYVFLPFFFLIVFLLFSVTVPTTTITLRCVPESQRSFAMGLQQVCTRLLGTIPGPVLFGVLFDSTCVVWQDKCGAKGSCWLYDNESLGKKLLILIMAFKLSAAFFFFLAYKLYKAPSEAQPVISNQYTQAEAARALEHYTQRNNKSDTGSSSANGYHDSGYADSGPVPTYANDTRF